MKVTIAAAPPFPFKGLRAPKMNIAPLFFENTLMISLLSQVEQGVTGAVTGIIHNDIVAVTGVTGENQQITHAHARACARVFPSLHFDFYKKYLFHL